MPEKVSPLVWEALSSLLPPKVPKDLLPDMLREALFSTFRPASGIAKKCKSLPPPQFGGVHGSRETGGSCGIFGGLLGSF